MAPKPKAIEAGAKTVATTEAKTGTASEAQSGTMSPALGIAGTTADAAGAGTLAADADEALPVATIVVKGPAKGRWRIGRHFTQEPVSIPESALSPEQKEALASDPELTVILVEAPH
jgi:hypothetical protein